MPVLMIGTYGADGTPDVMNAAWGGITLEDEITICIDTSHKTWANIAARKVFTVAFGTADTVKACDYLGIASGNKTPCHPSWRTLRRRSLQSCPPHCSSPRSSKRGSTRGQAAAR